MLNRKIETPIKTRRFDMEEPIYTADWAYMRELRTHNRTRQILPVDPYAEVYQFRDNLYGIFQENIDGKGDVWSWLILGPEKALLIDTGFGLGNLKGLAEELAGGRELLTAITHAHPDHAGGNAQFEQVMALEEEIPRLKQMMESPLLNDKILGPDGRCLWVEFDPKDMIAQKPYTIVPLHEGDRISLGQDYEIEVIKLAGHSAGQAAFLDRTGRTLFPGDDLIAMRIGVMGGPGTLRDFRDRMARLAERTDEFDGIFPGHFIADLDSYAVRDVAEALEAICQDPSNYDYTEEGPRGTTFCKTVKGLGCIGYRPECV